MADAFAAADEIAGGGDGEADQRNIGVARLAWGLADIAKFEFDPPGLTVRLHTLADELAACRPRPAWRALVHFHRTVGTSTFRRRETRDAALWFHFDKATVFYALSPTTITVPADITAVHDLEGHALSVRPGESLKLEGQPVYLSR